MKRPASWLSNVPIFMQIDAREVCFHGCQLLTAAFLDLRFSAQMASFLCATTPPINRDSTNAINYFHRIVRFHVKRCERPRHRSRFGWSSDTLWGTSFIERRCRVPCFHRYRWHNNTHRHTKTTSNHHVAIVQFLVRYTNIAPISSGSNDTQQKCAHCCTTDPCQSSWSSIITCDKFVDHRYHHRRHHPNQTWQPWHVSTIFAIYQSTNLNIPVEGDVFDLLALVEPWHKKMEAEHFSFLWRKTSSIDVRWRTRRRRRYFWYNTEP